MDLHRTPMDRLGKVQVEGVVEEAGQRHEGRVTMRLGREAAQGVAVDLGRTR